MKFYRGFIIIIVSLLAFCLKEKTVVGTYVSRRATSMEAVRLMYLKGYYPFLEIPDDYIKLIIKKDSTFLYTINSKEHSGIWSVNGRILILDYTETSIDDLNLKIRDKKLYNITEATLCKSKEKMMRLLLLKKE
ncbi:hypothetical protein AMR72_09180 [Flavobacterium psychrophilum]|nr:hypothetical protein AMR72_09180 [Flavobacterium psychrophilum]AOE52663.1 hypothetical protein ALW18_09170 [Flavobacterium psychrophilum]